MIIFFDRYYLLFIVYYLLLIMYYLFFIIYCLLLIFNCLLFVIYKLLIIYCLLFIINYLLFIIYYLSFIIHTRVSDLLFKNIYLHRKRIVYFNIFRLCISWYIAFITINYIVLCYNVSHDIIPSHVMIYYIICYIISYNHIMLYCFKLCPIIFLYNFNSSI